MNQTYLPKNQKIVFLQAGWHADIVGEARKSFVQAMIEKGYNEDDIEIFNVPGGMEIPLMAKKLAETGQYAAVIGCALVVNGGIYRHDFVAGAIIDGMMRVQLDTGVPVLSLSMTPHNFHEHQEHTDYFFRHFQVKGQEVAKACHETLRNMNQVAERGTQNSLAA